jgi:hypothetical protein
MPGRGRPIYDVSPFIERQFQLTAERLRLNLRAEAFNVFTHPNFVGYVSTWGNGATAPPNLGTPLINRDHQSTTAPLALVSDYVEILELHSNEIEQVGR